MEDDLDADGLAYWERPIENPTEQQLELRLAMDHIAHVKRTMKPLEAALESFRIRDRYLDYYPRCHAMIQYGSTIIRTYEWSGGSYGELKAAMDWQAAKRRMG